jgi:serine/threonine-protein kinase
MPRTKTRLPASGPSDASDRESSESSSSDERIGSVVDDRYRIVDLIGLGGMGVVYRAEHVYIRRTVALKILHQEMAEHPQLFERFEREALAIGRLDHPNCVSVLDFGHLPDGACYLTMPFLEGPTLGDRMCDGPISVRRSLRIARHVASALAHIHNAGIVHRDVKPENIVMVDREGDADFATLLDFGIAKLVQRDAESADERRAELTIAGQRFGTPAYMSPEQAIGAPLDHRADLYALSVILFEMLCGARPFEEDDPVRLMEMQERAPVPSMSAVADDVSIPGAVEALVRKGLAKRANERFADAVEFIAAIDACLDVPTATAKARPLYRRPRVVVGAGVAIVAIVAAALVFWPSSAGESHSAAHGRSLISQGKPIQAIAYLEGNPALAEHADAHLQLGHAYSATGRYGDAVASYGRALTRQPGLSNDADLANNLRLVVDGDDVAIATQAAELLLGRVADEATRAHVTDMASSHEDLRWRTQMREVAEHHGMSEDIDWLASHTLDLAQAETCEERRRSTARLRSLGDPNAISALERARDRADNRCLRDEADEAIAALRSRTTVD